MVRIEQIILITALFPCQVASVKAWNEWSIIDSFRTMSPTNCSQMYNAVSNLDTVNHVVRFQTFCREAFIRIQHLNSVMVGFFINCFVCLFVCLFFYSEKSYDTNILSATVCSVPISSITQCLTPVVHCSLYVDDF